MTDKTYGDFVLKAKVKYPERQFGHPVPQQTRTTTAWSRGLRRTSPTGYWGLLYEERGRGILERYPEEKANEIVKKDDWNEFVITAKGQHVTIDLNGTRVIDREDPKFDKDGIIALQVHVGPAMEVRYKDIEIKELAP